MVQLSILFLFLFVTIVCANMFSFLPQLEKSRKFQYDPEPSNAYIMHFLEGPSTSANLEEQGYRIVKSLKDVHSFVGKVVSFKTPHVYYTAIKGSIKTSSSAWKNIPYYGFIDYHVLEFDNGLGYQIEVFKTPYTVSSVFSLNNNVLSLHGPLYLREATLQEMESCASALEEKRLLLNYGGEEIFSQRIRSILAGNDQIPKKFLMNYREPQGDDIFLHTFCKTGDLAAVKYSVNTDSGFRGFFINAAHYTPFGIAALCGEVEIFKFLFDKAQEKGYQFKLDHNSDRGLHTLIRHEIFYAEFRIARGIATEKDKDLPERLKTIYNILTKGRGYSFLS